MGKYTVMEGANIFESDSRNARKHLKEGGYNRVDVFETSTGKYLCTGIKNDERIVVSTEPTPEVLEIQKNWVKYKGKANTYEE